MWNMNCVSSRSTRGRPVVLLVLVGFILFMLSNYLSARFQFNNVLNDFRLKTMFDSFCILFCIYLRILVSNTISIVTRRVSQEIVTLPEHPSSPLVFMVRVARSLAVCVIFYRSLFVLFLLPLCCLSFFDLRLLITPLVSLSFFLMFVLHVII